MYTTTGLLFAGCSAIVYTGHPSVASHTLAQDGSLLHWQPRTAGSRSIQEEDARSVRLQSDYHLLIRVQRRTTSSKSEKFAS